MSTEHCDDVIGRISQAMADDAVIDWDREHRSHPELGVRLARLQAVDSITSSHRALVEQTLSDARYKPIVIGGAPASKPDDLSTTRRWWQAVAAVAILAVAVAGYQIWNVMSVDALAIDTGLFVRVGDDARQMNHGAHVAAEDKVFLELSTNRDTYVYIFNVNGAGDCARLFPVPDSPVSNPLVRGEHRLPPISSWRVGPPLGDEAFLVVASVEPQHALEAALARVPWYGPTPPEAKTAIADSLRGLGPEIVGEAAVSTPNDLVELVSELDTGSKLATWAIVVKNLPETP